MLRAIIDLVFGGLILCFGVYGIWSGVRYGVFPGLLVSTRASPDEQPITFWINLLMYSAFVIVALFYLLFVVRSLLRGINVP